MHMKKALCVCLSLAIAGSVFAGCSREQTPEEIEAASLAAVTQEEQATGMKRLDSPNLTDYEKPLANFVSGIQAKDAAKIATALGSVNIFGDTLDGWIVSNNYESLQTEDLHDIKIQSSKDGKVATINVFFEEPNEDKSNFVEYKSDFDGKEWNITPPTGLSTDYTFYAPVSSVSINDVDMSTYAASDSNYGYAFNLPRVIETDSSPDCVLNTSIGKYSGKIINASTSSYGSALPIAMAVFTEDQKKEINQYFVDCANSVFDMMRTGADRDSYSAYLLDSNAVSAIFDVDGDDKQAAIANEANAVSRIEVLSTESVAGYPDAYIYHFSSGDSITMNIRYNAVLSSGECHRCAAVTMTYTNGSWKIAKINSTNSLFTDLTAFNPEW